MAEDVDVLIGSFGRLEQLAPCLASIFETTRGGGVSLRVIVGLQGNGDVSATLLSRFPRVEPLRTPNKLGVCRAYNQLMSHCTGRYALLLDDDTILRPGAIETMVRFMDAHPNVGIAGCRTVNLDGSYQKSTGSMFSPRTELCNTLRPAAFWRDGIDETVTAWRSADWVNGAFLMVRAEVIDQVGGFDEYFHILVHEPDWCLRIRRAGWEVAYVPEAEVVHLGNALSVARPVKSYESLVRYHVNRYYFCRKHYGDAAVRALRPVMSLGALLRLLNYAGIWLLSPARRPEAGPKVKAFWRILWLGAAAKPDGLPEDLRREHDTAGFLQPCLPK